MAVQSFAVHGLRVRSEIPLPLQTSGVTLPPDVEVRVAQTVRVPDAPPPGASYGSIGEAPWREWWTLDRDTWRIRIAGCCEMRIRSPWRCVEVDTDPEGTADVIADRVLKTGVLFALERQGRHVLHATAVTIGDATIALVGASGSGKSTLAALLCADGAALVSDDQLRIDFQDGAQVRCYPGLSTLRLRPAVEDLAPLVAGTGGRSWDGRTTVVPTGVVGSKRLDVLALPTVTASADAPRIDTLSPAAAMLVLAQSRATPRVSDWVRDRFQMNANLVERLPAFRIQLPRGRLPSDLERLALLEPLLAASRIAATYR